MITFSTSAVATAAPTSSWRSCPCRCPQLPFQGGDRQRLVSPAPRQGHAWGIKGMGGWEAPSGAGTIVPGRRAADFQRRAPRVSRASGEPIYPSTACMFSPRWLPAIPPMSPDKQLPQLLATASFQIELKLLSPLDPAPKVVLVASLPSAALHILRLCCSLCQLISF